MKYEKPLNCLSPGDIVDVRFEKGVGKSGDFSFHIRNLLFRYQTLKDGEVIYKFTREGQDALEGDFEMQLKEGEATVVYVKFQGNRIKTQVDELKEI